MLSEPGAMRAILFNVMLIAGVSTLAFNGNPLLRYDAYYILADLIEMPNLANRSLRYWEYMIKRYLIGIADAEQPQATRGEKAWFMFYGPASAIYRILVTIAIALFIAGQFFVIGVILAIWAVVVMAVVPLVKGIRYLLESPALHVQRRRAIAITVGIVTTLIVFLFVVPMPFRSNAEGVIWFSDEAMVRAGANGFVGEFLATPGSRVSKGDVLIRCYDPTLEAQVRLSKAKVAELEAAYAGEFVSDRAKANIIREQMVGEQVAFDRIRERAEGLVVRAGTDGVFISPQADNMPGRYYHKGDLLGYVVEKGQPLARVVVAQDAVDMVRVATDRVTVRHVHRADTVSEGRIVRQAPGGIEYLPSRALSTEGGGLIATDPRDQKGAKVLQRMFQFDIELMDNSDAPFFGERVYVRFTHEMEPLGLQWYRSIRLLFLSHFNI
jgi:putative peptide zinc metalloprotease protein